MALREAAFIRLCKNGVRPLGRRYEVEVFEGVGWMRSAIGAARGAISDPGTALRCPLCEEGHTAADHGCPVEGFWEKGSPVPERGGWVQELSGFTPYLPGKYVPGEEGGPTGGQGAEVAPPPHVGSGPPSAAGRHASERPSLR